MPDPRQRIALFVDGAYLSRVSDALGFEVDFKRLLDEFGSQGTIVRACYYTVYEPLPYLPLRPLLDWLAYNGYAVVEHEVRSYPEADGIKKKWPRIELQIVVDAMDLSAHIDHMILFSANGNFRHLVAAVQRRGVHVTVVSTLHVQHLMIADALRRQADTFMELRDLRLKLQRPSTDGSQSGPLQSPARR